MFHLKQRRCRLNRATDEGVSSQGEPFCSSSCLFGADDSSLCLQSQQIPTPHRCDQYFRAFNKNKPFAEVRGDNKLLRGLVFKNRIDCKMVYRQKGTNIHFQLQIMSLGPNSIVVKLNSDSNLNYKFSSILFEDGNDESSSCQGKLRFIGEAEASGPSPS